MGSRRQCSREFKLAAADPAMYFWATGILSSFLDNAPTYQVFFNTVGDDPAILMGPKSGTLVAISAGAALIPLFGNGKQHGGTIRQVKQRGIKKVTDVFTLAILTINLRRIDRENSGFATQRTVGFGYESKPGSRWMAACPSSKFSASRMPVVCARSVAAVQYGNDRLGCCGRRQDIERGADIERGKTRLSHGRHIRQHGRALLAGDAQNLDLACFRERNPGCRGRKPDLNPVRDDIGDRVGSAFIGN